MAEGGAEQIKAAKKEARAAKRAEKGGGGGKSSKKSKSTASTTKEPTGGSGAGYKSKEFIVDSDSGKLGWEFYHQELLFVVFTVASARQSTIAKSLQLL